MSLSSSSSTNKAATPLTLLLLFVWDWRRWALSGGGGGGRMGTGIAPSEDGEEKQGAPTHEFPLISIKKFTILTSLVVWLIQVTKKIKKGI